jgi:hypothetical protein
VERPRGHADAARPPAGTGQGRGRRGGVMATCRLPSSPRPADAARLARTLTPAPPSRTEAGERLRPGPGVTHRTARLNRKAPGADGPTENYSARRSQSGSSGPAAEQVRAFGSSSMRLPGRKG